MLLILANNEQTVAKCFYSVINQMPNSQGCVIKVAIRSKTKFPSPQDFGCRAQLLCFNWPLDNVKALQTSSNYDTRLSLNKQTSYFYTVKFYSDLSTKVFSILGLSCYLCRSINNASAPMYISRQTPAFSSLRICTHKWSRTALYGYLITMTNVCI